MALFAIGLITNLRCRSFSMVPAKCQVDIKTVRLAEPGVADCLSYMVLSRSWYDFQAQQARAVCHTTDVLVQTGLTSVEDGQVALIDCKVAEGANPVDGPFILWALQQGQGVRCLPGLTLVTT